jgi:hypothetical protein
MGPSASVSLTAQIRLSPAGDVSVMENANWCPAMSDCADSVPVWVVAFPDTKSPSEVRMKPPDTTA